jgi:hypothetical protein
MCCARHDGHQHPAAPAGTGTAGGSCVHQQGSLLPSAIAHPNEAPQRVHVLIRKEKPQESPLR